MHAVHLSAYEIALLARHGCHVAHCPSSNLKLASGMRRSRGCSQRGINVGLGTDGAASNNRLDMLNEMRTAACSRRARAAMPTHVAGASGA